MRNIPYLSAFQGLLQASCEQYNAGSMILRLVTMDARCLVRSQNAFHRGSIHPAGFCCAHVFFAGAIVRFVTCGCFFRSSNRVLYLSLQWALFLCNLLGVGRYDFRVALALWSEAIFKAV